MSTLTLSSLTYLSRERLASLLSTPSAAAKVTVIDVRDSDHVGGHIKGSLWIPIGDLDHRLPELLRTLRSQEKVVFHCALSQVRGPKAALRYARERARALEKDQGSKGQGEGEGGGKKEEQQEVCVLEGGFTMWQAKYGEDEALTEGYVKDIWEDY